MQELALVPSRHRRQTVTGVGLLKIWAAIQGEYEQSEVAYFTSEEDANIFAVIESANGEQTWVEERALNHPDAIELTKTGISNWLYVHRSDGEDWVCYESFKQARSGIERNYFRVQVKAMTQDAALEKGRAAYAEWKASSVSESIPS